MKSACIKNRQLKLLAQTETLEENYSVMEYAVPLGILVALITWIVVTCIKFNHLRQQARHAWIRWGHATQQRNTCLLELSICLNGFLPREDVRPRQMKRLADDTQRMLSLFSELPPNDELRHLSHSERKLRDLVIGTVRTMEDSAEMSEDAELTELMNRLSLSLFRQDETTLLYNTRARAYNMALESPGAQWIAQLFGFASLHTIA